MDAQSTISLVAILVVVLAAILSTVLGRRARRRARAIAAKEAAATGKIIPLEEEKRAANLSDKEAWEEFSSR